MAPMTEAPKVLSINLTPKDFIDDVQHLTATEIGVYSMICWYIVNCGQDYDPPALPDDDQMLASIGKVSVAQWRKMKPRLCDGHMAVLTVANGFISQARIVEEIEAARARMVAGQIGGKASGEARRRKKVVLEERLRNDRSTIVRPPTGKQSNGSRTSHESRVTSYKEPSVPERERISTTARVEPSRREAFFRTAAKRILSDPTLQEMRITDPDAYAAAVERDEGWTPDQIADGTGNDALRPYRPERVHA